MICYRLQKFQYKICYSKIVISVMKNSFITGFQYKICYSKIFCITAPVSYHYISIQNLLQQNIALMSICIYVNTDFNTKFVIAKCFNYVYARKLMEFQYKICYSKIVELKAQIKELDKFQYKICYSKILVNQYIQYTF